MESLFLEFYLHLQARGQVENSEILEILENYLRVFSSPSFRVGPTCISRKLGDVWRSFGNFSKLPVSHC